jgi:hypothetical protein
MSTRSKWPWAAAAVAIVCAVFTIVQGATANAGTSYKPRNGVGYVRLHPRMSRYHVRLIVPQLLGSSLTVSDVNKAIRASAALLPAGLFKLIPSEREGPKEPPGFFYAEAQPGLTSSSQMLLNTLIPIYAGCGICSATGYWSSDAALIPNGQSVDLYDALFSHRGSALRAIAQNLRWQYRHGSAPNLCVTQMREARYPQLGSLASVLQDVSIAHAFALLAGGLEVGLNQGAIYDEACGDSGFLVPYRVIEPFLSSLGQQLVTSFEYEPVASGDGYIEPVRVCPTGLGISQRFRGPVLPRQQRVNVPAGIAKQIAVYTDSYGSIRILAPNGWKCEVSIDVDGGAVFEIYPPWENSPRFFGSQSWSRRASKRQGVTLFAEPACAVCKLSIACPYFASARTEIERGYPPSIAGRCRPPQGELVTQLSASVVRAVDPPDVVGANWPTGGPYTAISDIAWSGKYGGIDGASILTCTLPSRDETLCFDTLAWFEATNKY